MSFDNTKFEQTTHNAYYETIAFESDYSKYDDADVEKDIYFKSNCKINKIDGEIEANEMHEIVVKEIADRMVKELK